MKNIEVRNMAIRSITVIAFITANCAWSAPDETSRQAHTWKDGAEIYSKICAYCHEERVGPRIRKRELPPEYIQAVVRSGNRAMPAFRPSEIDDDSLKKLAEYISNN